MSVNTNPLTRTVLIISTSRNRSNDFSRPGKTATKAGAMSLFRDVLIMKAQSVA